LANRKEIWKQIGHHLVNLPITEAFEQHMRQIAEGMASMRRRKPSSISSGQVVRTVKDLLIEQENQWITLQGEICGPAWEAQGNQKPPESLRVISERMLFRGLSRRSKLADSATSDETITAIAGHISRKMFSHYVHIRTEAKRKAEEAIMSRRGGEILAAEVASQKAS
jgi:hypothetical protein